MADYENAVPNTPQTRFSVALITKPMTAMIARQLVAGQAPARTRCRNGSRDSPPATASPSTISSSTAPGIPHRVTADDGRPFRAPPPTWSSSRATTSSSRDRARSLSYSSGGYSVLARVLELASGQPYDALVAERILIPAGMTLSGGMPPPPDFFPGARAATW